MTIRYEEIEERNALDALILADKVTLFWQMFDQLGEDCQKVMRLHFEEKSIGEIMEIMDYSSEGYTRQAKFRCQKRLEKMIKEDARFAELTN